MLTHLEPRVSCTACNSLIAPYKIIIYKNVGPDAHIRPLVPDFIKALRSILFPPRRAAKANLDRYTPAAPVWRKIKPTVRTDPRLRALR